MIRIGIDPGQKGAVAILKDGLIIACQPLPFIGDELHIWKIGQLILGNCISEPDKLIIIENVHAMPHQGVTSMFNFGEGYGELIGLLKCLKIPYIKVAPLTWKKQVLNGMDWKGSKTVSCEYVLRKHPSFNLILPRCRTPHDGMADAICMAEYKHDLPKPKKESKK